MRCQQRIVRLVFKDMGVRESPLQAYKQAIEGVFCAGSCLVLKGNGADVAMHCVPPVKRRRMSITLRRCAALSRVILEM